MADKNSTSSSTVQWPSSRIQWQVTGSAEQPQLELQFGFKSQEYEGLNHLSVAEKTLTAAFTCAVDRTAAGKIENYSVSILQEKGEPSKAEILSVEVAEDAKSVLISVDGTGESENREVALTLVNVTADDHSAVFSGTARCSINGAGQSCTSPVAERAMTDLQFYSQMIGETSPQLLVDTSLLNHEIIFSDPDFIALTEEWIAPVCSFLTDRADGNSTAAPPAETHTVAFALDTANLNTGELFPLQCSLLTKRGTTKTGTALFPYSESEVAPHSFDAFATQLENILRTDEWRFHVARHTAKSTGGYTLDGTELWAVRKGVHAGQAFSYSIDTSKEPVFFGVKPVATGLYDLQKVPVYDFNPVTGIDFNKPSRYFNFTAVEVDPWMHEIFQAMDHILSPENVEALQIIDQKRNTGYHVLLRDTKAAMAVTAAKWLIPLLAGAQTDTSRVQELFRQQLLHQLSNAYRFNLAVQYQASVTAPAPSGFTPKLYGEVSHDPGTTNEKVPLTITPARVNLKPGSQHFSFMVGWTEGQPCNSHAEYNLRYNPDKILHQPGRLLVDGPWEELSWLEFITAEGKQSFSTDIGKMNLPLPLRNFPQLPVVPGHETIYSPAGGEEDMTSLLRWNYAFTYTLPSCTPQDILSFNIRFNRSETPPPNTAIIPELFNSMAQFVMTYHAMKNALNDSLAAVRKGSADPATLKTADMAVHALCKMISSIKAGMTAFHNTSQHSSGHTTANDYSFDLREGTAIIEGINAWTISIKGKMNTDLHVPFIEVENYTTVASASNEKNVWLFYFRDSKGHILTAGENQGPVKRKITIPALNVLNHYETTGNMILTRNAELLPGKITAGSFVYNLMGDVFPGSCIASFENTGELEIPKIDVASGTHHSLPLLRHLQNLFGALLRGYAADSIIVGAVVSCEYLITPSMPVRVPVFLQAPISLLLRGDAPDDVTVERCLDEWAQRIKTWYEITNPHSPETTFRFDLQLYTGTVDELQPLIRFSQLSLGVRYITDLDPSKA